MELHDHSHLRDAHRDEDVFVILSWFLSRASLEPSNQACIFQHLYVIMLIIPRDVSLTFGFNLDYRDRTFDNGWFHVTRFSTYHTSDAILGHILLFQLWGWLFSQRLVTIHITRSRNVYSHWWPQSRWCLPRWAFNGARPQGFDCPTIHDFLVDWDRNSYPGRLFSCDSIVDHSFHMTMDSPSRASRVRGIRIVMTLHQASCFS